MTYRFAYGLEKISAVVYGVSGAGNAAQTYPYPNGQQSVVKLWYQHSRLRTVDFLTNNTSGAVASYVSYDDWGAPTSKATQRMGARELVLLNAITPTILAQSFSACPR